MVEVVLLLVTAGVAAPLAGEWAARSLLRQRIAHLVADVVQPLTPLAVHLPPGALLPDLSRGRLPPIEVRADRVGLPGVEVEGVIIHLLDVRVDHRLAVVAGSGTLRGHLTAEEVMSRAGVPGAIELAEGVMTMRWPAPRSGRPSIAVRLRPVLAGDRIRLAPTPVTLTLPALPNGARLVDVQARADGLHVEAALDLPTLLSAS